MASFREQMQRLADNIAKSRNERKAFLDRNKKECKKNRREQKDQRHQIKIELEKESNALAKRLNDFKRSNQRTVEKTLRDMRSVRLKEAKSTKAILRQEIIKNKRDIARMIRQNKNDRVRAARQQFRVSSTTLQSVRSHVQRIRIDTKRMTKSWARDRIEARQIWFRLQSGIGVRRDSGFFPGADTSTLVVSDALDHSNDLEQVIPQFSGLPVPTGIAVEALT